MTPERAQYILENALTGGSFKYAFYRDWSPFAEIYQDGITKEEDLEIRNVWETMNGSASYDYAVRKIAERG